MTSGLAGWSEWKRFPDPRNAEMLTAPIGPGCYGMRDATQLLLFRMSGNVAWRMTSLLPAPFGRGTRNNAAKRAAIFERLGHVEYRTFACATVEDAKTLESAMKARKADYLFRT